MKSLNVSDCYKSLDRDSNDLEISGLLLVDPLQQRSGVTALVKFKVALSNSTMITIFKQILTFRILKLFTNPFCKIVLPGRMRDA